MEMNSLSTRRRNQPCLNEVRPVSEDILSQDLLRSSIDRSKWLRSINQRGSEYVDEVITVDASCPVRVCLQLRRLAKGVYVSGCFEVAVVACQFDRRSGVLTVAKEFHHVVTCDVGITWLLPIAIVIGDDVIDLLSMEVEDVSDEGAKHAFHLRLSQTFIEVLWR